MKKFWKENSHEAYLWAAEVMNYPELPFGTYLRKILRKTDVVADVGCGFGVPALFMASLCSQVIAIDQDPYALRILEQEKDKRRITNVETRLGQWPDVDLEPCDVVVSFYHNRFAETADNVQKILNIAKRAGIMTSQGPASLPTLAEKVLPMLGLEVPRESCQNGCYAKSLLEAAGLKVECQQIIHDFSQPVRSHEEAAAYISNHLRLEEEHQGELNRILPEILLQKGNQLLIPIIRENCLLTWKHSG